MLANKCYSSIMVNYSVQVAAKLPQLCEDYDSTTAQFVVTIFINLCSHQ